MAISKDSSLTLRSGGLHSLVARLSILTLSLPSRKAKTVVNTTGSLNSNAELKLDGSRESMLVSQELTSTHVCKTQLTTPSMTCSKLPATLVSAYTWMLHGVQPWSHKLTATTQPMNQQVSLLSCSHLLIDAFSSIDQVLSNKQDSK